MVAQRYLGCGNAGMSSTLNNDDEAHDRDKAGTLDNHPTVVDQLYSEGELTEPLVAFFLTREGAAQSEQLELPGSLLIPNRSDSVR